MSSTPFGSRPASGLSKRRTQFRGPPASFFRNGGWGSQDTKRSAQAGPAVNTTTKARVDSAQASRQRGRGNATNGQGTEFHDDVPHFDQEDHFRVQEQQQQRRRNRVHGDTFHHYRDGGSLIKFLLVGGIIALAYGFPSELVQGRSQPVQEGIDETSLS